MNAPEPTRYPVPGGFPISAPHNAVMSLVQMYAVLLGEQEKKIEILSQQLAIEQRERLRLTKENTELRMAQSAKAEAKVQSAPEQ